jgi:hypothetical protein
VKAQPSSYSFSPIAGGFVALERIERFKAEVIAELALRSIGIILAVSPVFFLAAVLTTTGVMPAPNITVMSALCSASGLVLYAYGSRGFRRQMRLDTRNGFVSVANINVNGNARVEYRVDQRDIKSIYVQRSESQGDTAKLCLRVKGRYAPITLITGGSDEVRVLHRVFCETVTPWEPAKRKPVPLRSLGARNAAA